MWSVKALECIKFYIRVVLNSQCQVPLGVGIKCKMFNTALTKQILYDASFQKSGSSASGSGKTGVCSTSAYKLQGLHCDRFSVAVRCVQPILGNLKQCIIVSKHPIFNIKKNKNVSDGCLFDLTTERKSHDSLRSQQNWPPWTVNVLSTGHGSAFTVSQGQQIKCLKVTSESLKYKTTILANRGCLHVFKTYFTYNFLKRSSQLRPLPFRRWRTIILPVWAAWFMII